MTPNRTIKLRVEELLEKNNMTRYALCKKTAMSESTLKSIVDDKKVDVDLSSVLIIAFGFDMTVSEFFDSKIFAQENFENL